jgi:phage terminase Nu1 subunit (DNA packaging protein)
MSTEPKRQTRPAGSLKPLAEALGVTPRRVSQLLAAGMPDDPEAAIRWKAARETSDSSTAALRRERILLVRAQRQRVETENLVRVGELISSAEVRQSVYRVCRVVRDEFLKLGHDLPPRLEGLGAAAMSKLIRAEVIAILTRLSDESANAFGNPAG